MSERQRRPHQPLDLSLSQEWLDAALVQQTEQPYGNAAEQEMIRQSGGGGLTTFDLPDGTTCGGAEVADGVALGVCGGTDPATLPVNAHEERGFRGGLGLNVKF